MAAPGQPELRHGRVGLRLIRRSDARTLQRLLAENRDWLEPWEATNPDGLRQVPGSASMRPAVAWMLANAKAGTSVPFVITLDGRMVGQLTVSGITWGALRAANLGYWIAEEAAGHGVTTVAVALATDDLLFRRGLHRMEICIRPENAASLRIVEKLGFRPEGIRPRFIHIDGDWRDHAVFALNREEVPGGVLRRFLG
ncbi:GNAT family N-acetyltransferase [Leucobacter sp. M11]|uniref:GNAT family N-acetyltransferase n=1 Tax=Leucobacter sp. M11 TaxID=2993565 RepID=UPI002D7E57B3|nr:GNAT family protein [Leucobacter sp. M11]MEB4614102.1 GNAT family protein [Leucobacter sp. M11]